MQNYRLLGLPLTLGIILFILVYVFTHYTGESTPREENSATQFSISTNTVTEEPPVLPPLNEQLGRLFMIGHWAHTPVASTTELIRAYHIGGVIIMSAPEDPSEIKAWTEEWQAAAEYPLLIAIDQEGGEVSRLKGADFTQTAQPNITTEEVAYEVGFTRGKELTLLGINTNLAPVVERSVNPNGFLYRRVFRDQSDIVPLANAMLEGFQGNDIIGVIKHYPGHPDSPADSHETLPVVELGDTTFTEYTHQFNELIASGDVSILMTAHVLVPEVDTEYPATLSHTILTEELRQRQNYNGVILTDDMTMDAIDTEFSTANATQLALQAGADLIMFAAEPMQIESVIPTTITTIENGDMDADIITEHYRRVEALLVN